MFGQRKFGFGFGVADHGGDLTSAAPVETRTWMVLPGTTLTAPAVGLVLMTLPFATVVLGVGTATAVEADPSQVDECGGLREVQDVRDVHPLRRNDVNDASDLLRRRGGRRIRCDDQAGIDGVAVLREVHLDLEPLATIDFSASAVDSFATLGISWVPTRR